LPEIYVAVDRPLGWLELEKGRHTLSFVCVGRDGRSSGYYLGINDVVLERIPAVPATTPSEERTVAIQSAGVVYRGRPLPAYLQQLKSASAGERAGIVRAIGSFGSDAAPAVNDVAKALGDGDAEVRVAAAWALSQMGATGVTAVPALEKSLKDPSPRVRTLSAVALRAMGEKAVAAVPALVRALNDSAAYVRAPTADALGNVGAAAKSAVQALTERLLVSDEQVYVLRSAAAALGNIGPDAASALPALQQALKMHRVTYTAQEAIMKIKRETVPTWY
jgi:HEAT repeat protein